MNADRDLMLHVRGWLAADERELPGPVRASVMAAIDVAPRQRHRWLRPWPNPWGRHSQLRSIAILGMLIALLALLAAAWLVPFGGSSLKPAHVENGWIAFSTQPHSSQVTPTDIRKGGDIYIAHDREDLRMLVSRGPGMDTNVCPAFSPDGTRLAYGQLSDAGAAIVILDLASDGTITGRTSFLIDPTNTAAPCPRWSADGARIGSLERRNLVVVHGLDGSVLEAAAGDPTFADFAADAEPLVSPSGELSVAMRYEDGQIIFVQPLDGSPVRTIATQGYGIAGWSPDSSKVLLTRDVGMAMSVYTVSVEEPFTKELIADAIPVNGARSWPGRRDVSWQTLIE